MTDSTLTSANLIAQMAPDDSVTTDILADEERQFADGRLAADSEASVYSWRGDTVNKTDGAADSRTD